MRRAQAIRTKRRAGSRPLDDPWDSLLTRSPHPALGPEASLEAKRVGEGWTGGDREGRTGRGRGRPQTKEESREARAPGNFRVQSLGRPHLEGKKRRGGQESEDMNRGREQRRNVAENWTPPPG